MLQNAPIKNVLIVAVFMWLLYGCCPNYERKTYYPHDDEALMISEVVSMCSQELNGLKMYYSLDGTILNIESYSKGERDGLSTQFCDGKKSVLFENNYSNGELDGNSVEYYCENGVERSVIAYENGKIMNVVKLLAPTGERLQKGDHKDGNGEFLKYDETGRLSAQIRVRDGKLNGYSVFFTNTGYVDSIYYVDGFSEGVPFETKSYAGFGY
jgi:antitoxin component YwqK of YwqJK toxin-antitoxin module